jgi:hypothetical protein
MSRLRAFLFLTLVQSTLIIAYSHASEAAPTKSTPDMTTTPATEDRSEPLDQKRLETIDITQPSGPPPKIERTVEYFYRYRKAFTARLGAGYDSKAAADGKGNLYDAGISVLLPYQLQSYEAGADLFSDGSGLLHAYQRFIHGTGRIRPYSKIGAGVRIVPEDQLATVLRYQHYQLRGGGGIEFMTKEPISARMDFEAALSARGAQALLTVGCVVAW